VTNGYIFKMQKSHFQKYNTDCQMHFWQGHIFKG